jgi:phenylalanyl-tRNA synthetase beta chain
MKIYLKHLFEVCGSPQLEIDQLIESLTMAGLEVESLSPPLPKLNNIVIGKVLTVEKHPNADRLHICKVDVGQAESLNIVCGAQNVRSGLIVAVALEGAVLPSGLEIKRAKLRGIESVGMICSSKELGLSEESSGVIELSKEFLAAELPSVGKEIYPYIKDKNRYIEINITPNRGDCLSVLGVAREVAINNKISLNKLHIFPLITKKISGNNAKYSVVIKNPEACPHYVACVIHNIKPHQSTPEYIKNALVLNGINPISLLVDITNYVMLECGQPMHAFDLDKISDGVVVRYAHAGEKITLLDGKSYDLNQSETLVIADCHKPLALAGIMGGSATSISENTTDVLLESAFFIPDKIAVTSRYYDITTDSSSRFSRGVDSKLQLKAMNFATSLIAECATAEIGQIFEVKSEKYLPKKHPITLRKARVERILGVSIADKDVTEILKRLEMKVSKTGNEWKVFPPNYRFDINQEIDLIEELARIYGYAQIPTRKPLVELAQESIDNVMTGYERLPLKRIKSLLADRGYQEIMTYSFISSKLQTLFTPQVSAIKLKNPISQEMDVMRVSLLTGLINTLLYNQNHQQTRMRLFETGMCFLNEDDKLIQKKLISGLSVGENYPLQWGVAKRHTDFFDIKSDIEALLSLNNSAFVFEKLDDKTNTNVFHPYKSATVYLIINNNKINLGCCGELHPHIKQNLKIRQNVYLFEIDLSLLEKILIPIFSPISKFPSISRDLAIIVDEKVSAKAIQENIFTTTQQFSEKTGISFGKNIYQTDASMVIFDTYQGECIAKGKKSLALSLTFQHFAHTLQDEEINELINLIISELEKKFQAILRA